jgi:hypothetical protein
VKRYFLIGTGLLIALAAFFAVDRTLWLIDDDDHPDALLLREQFADAKADNKSSVSVIAVNGGNWLALCLVGAGENPQETLRSFARTKRIRVPGVQRFRSWFYVGNVPKGELALVFVTERTSVRSRRLPDFIGAPNFKKACAERADAGLAWR